MDDDTKKEAAEQPQTWPGKKKWVPLAEAAEQPAEPAPEAKPRDPEEAFRFSRGAQVVLTGDARSAARGGFHGEIADNTNERDLAIAAGHVAHSFEPSPDLKPSDHAVKQAMGVNPADEPSVEEAEFDLQVAKEREQMLKDRVAAREADKK